MTNTNESSINNFADAIEAANKLDKEMHEVSVEVEARSLRKDDEFKHGAKGTVRVTATKLGQKNVKVTYAYLKGTDIVEANTYLPALELVTVTRNVETEASEASRRMHVTLTRVIQETTTVRRDAVVAKIEKLNAESGLLARDLIDLGVELAKAEAVDQVFGQMRGALEHWAEKLDRSLTAEEVAYISFKFLTHRMMGYLSQSPAGGWSGGALSSSNMVEVAQEHATREIFGDSYGSLFAHLRYVLKEFPTSAETVALFDFDSRD